MSFLRPSLLRFSVPLLLVVATSCALEPSETTGGTGGTGGARPEDRLPGDRSPLTAACDAMDPVRCLLPWPSSTFTRKDSTSPTGLRLAIDPTSIPAGDDPASINAADGFSRVTPLVTAFPTALAPIDTPAGAPGPIRLVLAQPGHPRHGEQVPLRLRVEQADDGVGGIESMLFAYPLGPLEPGADYVAVVLDDLTSDSGAPIAPEPRARVALGLAEPTSADEAALAAYHAPTRGVLEKAGIDAARVIRVWDFTTRSASDATRRLAAMREALTLAVESGAAGVEIDLVDVPTSGSLAVIVEGRITGLPDFAAAGRIDVDANGLPIASGTRDAPFRVTVPVGVGDYPFTMYGHGTGGEFHDSSFDRELGDNGAGKVGVQFDGWTEADVLETLVGFARMFQGTHRSTARLMQAQANAAAIEAAVAGPLGDALAAATLGGKPNPAAGRRPDASTAVWAGGSLGGTMGLVYLSGSPTTRSGVLNVPGAAWSHFIPGSNIFASVRSLLAGNFGTQIDVDHALAMSQGNWDDIDGAVWSADLDDPDRVILIQESIGDPVLPNPGTEVVARVTRAVQLGAVLVPIHGVSPASGVSVGATAITQYRVSDPDALDIHGFAARNTPAGAAARDQMTTFLQSVWAGAPVISLPAGCAESSCDFTDP